VYGALSDLQKLPQPLVERGGHTLARSHTRLLREAPPLRQPACPEGSKAGPYTQATLSAVRCEALAPDACDARGVGVGTLDSGRG
jgi:hypothetical protein